MKSGLVLFLSFILLVGCNDESSRHPKLFDTVFIKGLKASDAHGFNENIFRSYSNFQAKDSVISFLQSVSEMWPDAYYHQELYYIQFSDTVSARKLLEDRSDISENSPYSSDEFVKIASRMTAKPTAQIIASSGESLNKVFIKIEDRVVIVKIIKNKIIINKMTWKNFKQNFPDVICGDIENKFCDYIFSI